ncbi:MAG: MFS transporter [Candidatus Margulisbacteria bacterium]|nr:MFS transporter [Candidatus Margulisiibacteriota bacterium]
MKNKKAEKLFHNKNFLFLWMAQIFCQLADRVFTYILMITAYEYFHSNLGTSLPMLTFAIPAILFSALFGVFVDRWKKKPILFISNLLRAFLVLLIPLLSLHPQVALIFLLAVLVFTVAQIFAPAETTAIPGIVQHDQLVFANALFMGAWMGASVLGFGVAVLVIQFFKITVLYQAAAILYCLAAISIMGMKLHEPERYVERHPVNSIIHELHEGLRFILKNHIVYIAFFMLFMALSGLAAISVLTVGYASKILKIAGRNFGLLVTFAGVGMALGIIWVEKIEKLLKKKFFLIEGGFVICGTSLMGIALTKDVYWACFAIFVLGFGNAFISAPIQAFLQGFIPENMRGRVFGVQNMVVSLAFTFPAVVAGYLADLFSIPAVFFCLGAVILLIGLTARLVPDFKKI